MDRFLFIRVCPENRYLAVIFTEPKQDRDRNVSDIQRLTLVRVQSMSPFIHADQDRPFFFQQSFHSPVILLAVCEPFHPVRYMELIENCLGYIIFTVNEVRNIVQCKLREINTPITGFIRIRDKP